MHVKAPDVDMSKRQEPVYVTLLMTRDALSENAEVYDDVHVLVAVPIFEYDPRLLNCKDINGALTYARSTYSILSLTVVLSLPYPGPQEAPLPVKPLMGDWYNLWLVPSRAARVKGHHHVVLVHFWQGWRSRNGRGNGCKLRERNMQSGDTVNIEGWMMNKDLRI